jgi:hypothetical protein
MDYIITAVCFATCIVIIVFGLKVLKESRAMGPKKKNTNNDDDEHRRLSL